MAEQSVVLAVGSYRTVTAAEADCRSLWALHRHDGSDELAAALMEKGAGGELEIDRVHSTAQEPVWGVVLLGAAVTVLAVPLGIEVLNAGLTSRDEWAGAAVVVGRLWHRLPRDVLRTMCNLLEAGQAGLTVVSLDHAREDVVGCFSNAAGKVVAAGMKADLAGDFTRVIGAA